MERELAICFMNQAILVGETEGELAAVGRYDRALETFERLVRRAGRRECTHELAICSMNKGCALAGLGNDTDAMILLDRAIQILEQEVREDARSSLREDLALCLMNRAIPFARAGKWPPPNRSSNGLSKPAMPWPAKAAKAHAMMWGSAS